MSRSKDKGKPPGWEFWSRRPTKNRKGLGKEAKKHTHRLERCQDKKIERSEEGEEFSRIWICGKCDLEICRCPFNE